MALHSLYPFLLDWGPSSFLPTKDPGSPASSSEPNAVHGWVEGYPEAGRGYPARPASTHSPGSQLAPAGQESRCLYRLNSDQPVPELSPPCRASQGEAAQERRGPGGRGGCLAASDLLGPPFPLMLLTCSTDGGLAPIQLSKQKNRPGSRHCRTKLHRLLDRVRVDALMGSGEAEVREGCVAALKHHEKVGEWNCIYLQILRTRVLPRDLPLGPHPACPPHPQPHPHPDSGSEKTVQKVHEESPCHPVVPSGRPWNQGEGTDRRA